MTFGEFYRRLKTEVLPGASRQMPWKYYLQAPLVWYDEELAEGGEARITPLRQAPPETPTQSAHPGAGASTRLWWAVYLQSPELHLSGA